MASLGHQFSLQTEVSTRLDSFGVASVALKFCHSAGPNGLWQALPGRWVAASFEAAAVSRTVAEDLVPCSTQQLSSKRRDATWKRFKFDICHLKKLKKMRDKEKQSEKRSENELNTFQNALTPSLEMLWKSLKNIQKVKEERVKLVLRSTSKESHAMSVLQKCSWDTWISVSVTKPLGPLTTSLSCFFCPRL